METAILKRARSVHRQIRRRREDLVRDPVPVREFGPAEQVAGKPDWIR